MTMQKLEQCLFDAEKSFEQELYFEGKEYLENALQEEPTYGKAHNHMGWLYLFHLNDYDKAERHLNLALKYSVNEVAAYMHMTTLLFDQNRLSELEEFLSRAGKVKGMSRSFLFNEYGRLNEVQGKYNTAISKYKMAIRWSLNDQEIAVIKENISRCRSKRWYFLW